MIWLTYSKPQQMEQVYHYFWLGFYQILSFGVASDTKGGSIAGFRSIHHWDLNPQRGCNTKRAIGWWDGILCDLDFYMDHCCNQPTGLIWFVLFISLRKRDVHLHCCGRCLTYDRTKSGGHIGISTHRLAQLPFKPNQHGETPSNTMYYTSSSTITRH